MTAEPDAAAARGELCTFCGTYFHVEREHELHLCPNAARARPEQPSSEQRCSLRFTRPELSLIEKALMLMSMDVGTKEWAKRAYSALFERAHEALREDNQWRWSEPKETNP